MYFSNFREQICYQRIVKYAHTQTRMLCLSNCTHNLGSKLIKCLASVLHVGHISLVWETSGLDEPVLIYRLGEQLMSAPPTPHLPPPRFKQGHWPSQPLISLKCISLTWPLTRCKTHSQAQISCPLSFPHTAQVWNLHNRAILKPSLYLELDPWNKKAFVEKNNFFIYSI